MANNPEEIATRLLKSKYGVSEDEIHSISLFGSQVYRTSDKQSDYDYIVLTNTKINNQEIKHPVANVHIYTIEHFKDMLRNHKIQAMESLFYNDMDFDFKLDLSKLRHEISSVSSNSFVKAKKKIIVEKDEYYIGIKSLFHAIRIIDFGTQIAEQGSIKDFSSMNWLWKELKSQHWTWEELNTKYKPLLNEKMTEFRKLAPKEVKKQKTMQK